MGLAGTVVEVVSDFVEDFIHDGFERRREIGRAHASAQENHGVGVCFAHGAVGNRETTERVQTRVGVSSVRGVKGDAARENGRGQRRVREAR